MEKQETGQRQQIYIGGEGLKPVMWKSQIKPDQVGDLSLSLKTFPNGKKKPPVLIPANEYACNVTVDTPDKRYAVEMQLGEEEYERFCRQRGKTRIESICGVTIEEGEAKTVYENINGERVRCKTSDAVLVADETATPINGELCAVKLTGVGMVFTRVQVEELPEDTRRAYLDTLNSERKDKATIEPKQPGRKPTSDFREDAKVYAHWKEQRALNGRLTLKLFHTDFYASTYTLTALEKMLDRARKRAASLENAREKM